MLAIEFRDMNIGKKLLLGFLVVVVMMGIMDFTGYKSMHRINDEGDNIFGE